MILCSDGEYWYCCTGVSREKDQVGVRLGSRMAQPPGLIPLPPIGAQMYGLRPFTGMLFFPELLYRGCRVTPVSWHATATEPLLLVHMTQEDLDFSKYFVKPPNRTGHEIKRAMEADGWSWDLREDGYRYLHVDELEKIEGLPPEGAF